ncbi:MAG: GNAT family N-acetyltransferase [Acidimicrobiales bacterium]
MSGGQGAEPGAVVVRPAEPEELEEVSRLTVAAYRALPGPGLSDGYAAELADAATRATQAVVLVAVAGEHLAGSVAYVPDPTSPMAEDLRNGEAGIRMLAVAPEAQGRGTGTALVAACLDRAVRAGRRAVFLHSTEWMSTAHRLYLRAGFRRVEERDWEIEPGFSLLGFAKDLDSCRG